MGDLQGKKKNAKGFWQTHTDQSRNVEKQLHITPQELKESAFVMQLGSRLVTMCHVISTMLFLI